MAAQTAETLGLDASAALPSYPSASTSKLPIATSNTSTSEISTKRKATEDDGETNGEGDEDDQTKKAKTSEKEEGNGSIAVADPMGQHQAAMVSAFLGVLDPESLKTPVLPGIEEMGKILLEVRKRALREEYGV